MRGRLLLLCAAALQAACTWGHRSPPDPTLDAVIPGLVLAGAPVTLALHGQHLFAALTPELTSAAPHPVDYRFEVRLGAQVLAGEAVRFVDSTRLEVDAPALPAGVYDVAVRTPDGREAVLERGLAVVRQLPLHRLVFVTPEQQLPAGECSKELQVELQDAFGSPTVLDAPAALEVWADNPLVRLFRDPACTEAADRVEVPAGASTARFYAMGLWVGEAMLAARCGDALADQRARFTAAQRCDVSELLEGAACDDGLACTSGERCAQGVCKATDWSGCPQSVPPRACFTATPRAAAPGEQITFDASCSTDADDATGTLRVRYDFDADGDWDTAWLAPGPTQHPYEGAGVFEPLVEVSDPHGGTGSAQRMLIVSDDVVRVTTVDDESSGGARPDSPGGNGLSLREAITYVNGLGTPSTIWIPGGFELSADALPGLTAPGASIVGGEGVRIDFVQTGGSNCLQLDAPNQRLVGLHLVGCRGHIVELKFEGDQVADCRLEGPAVPLKIGGPSVIIGPRNVFTGFGSEAIQVKGLGSLIVENQFTRNAGEVVSFMNGSGGVQRVLKNVFFENAGIPLHLEAAPGFTAWFNTFHANAADAIQVQGATSAVDVRNNVFSANGGYGISASAGSTLSAAPNAFFGNGGGAAVGLGPQGGWITAPPGLIDPEGGDFRPAFGSVLIDAAAEVGFDVNGPLAGSYFGAAPDLGAFEAR